MSEPDNAVAAATHGSAAGLQVRELTPHDAAAYRALILQAYDEAADAFTSTAAERATEPIEFWLGRIRHPRGLGQGFGVFGDDGALAGAVSIEYSAKPKTRHKALLVGMYVRPAARGAGAGAALLAAAIAHARRQPGLRAVMLTVTEGNAPALRLYEAAGFAAFGTEPLAIYTGREFKAKVHMQLVLAR